MTTKNTANKLASYVAIQYFRLYLLLSLFYFNEFIYFIVFFESIISLFLLICSLVRPNSQQSSKLKKLTTNYKIGGLKKLGGLKICWPEVMGIFVIDGFSQTSSKPQRHTKAFIKLFEAPQRSAKIKI